MKRNARKRQSRWTFRRRIVILSLVFCAGCVLRIMLYGSASSSDAIVSGCFTLAGAVIGSYVFGAVWDDKNSNNIDDDEEDFFKNPEAKNDHGP